MRPADDRLDRPSRCATCASSPARSPCAPATLVVDGRATALGDVDDEVDAPPTSSPSSTAPSERLIVDALRAARPDDAIVGEEGTDRRRHQRRRAGSIDPIDGTTNFLYDLPGYAVRSPPPTTTARWPARCTCRPLDELFTAARGGGRHAQRRADPLQRDRPTSARRWSPPASATTPSARRDQARASAGLIARRPRHPPHRVRPRSTCATSPPAGSTCTTSSGSDRWDSAAGELIAREAGCRTATSRGGPARPAEVLVAARHPRRCLDADGRAACRDAAPS